MYQLVVFVHLLAAMLWVGGMLVLAVVVVPAARGLPPEARAPLFTAVGTRFRHVGWVCVALLVLTGVLQLAFRAVTWSALTSSAFWATAFGRVLALKLALVVVMLAISLYHDLVLGPASARSPVAAPALRRRSQLVARAAALLAVLVALLGVLLARGVPGG